MNKVKFEEFKNMSYEDQIQHLEEKIQQVREAKSKAIENIRKLEEHGEECNKQIERLLELKWNCKSQMMVNEALDGFDNIFTQ